MANPVNLGAKPPIVPTPDNGTRKAAKAGAPTNRFNQTLDTKQKSVKKLARKKLQTRLTLQKREHARLAEQKRQQAANGARLNGRDASVAARDARPSDAAMRRPMEQATENLLKQQQEKDGAPQDDQGSGQQRQQPEHQDDASPRAGRGRADRRPITNTANLASDTGSRSIVHRENIRSPAPGAVEQNRPSPFAMNLLMRQTPKTAQIERPGGGRSSTTDRLRIAPPSGQHHAIELNLRELTPQALTERSTQPDGTIREVAPHQANPLLFGRAVIHFNGHHELSREIIVRYREGSQGERAELVDPRQSDLNSAQGVLQLRQIKAARDNGGVAVYTPTQPVTLPNLQAPQSADPSAHRRATGIISPAYGLPGAGIGPSRPAADNENRPPRQSLANTVRTRLTNSPKRQAEKELNKVITKFNNDTADKDTSLANTLRTEHGIKALKHLKPTGGLSRDSHQDIITALGRISGPDAFDVLLFTLLNDKNPHTLQPASDAIKSLVANNPFIYNDSKTIKTMTEKLSATLLAVANQNTLDLQQYSAIISALPSILNIYRDDDTNEQIAKTLTRCIKRGQSTGDTDKCNLAFRALLNLDGITSKKYISVIPPHPEWLTSKQYHLLDGQATINSMIVGGKNAAFSLIQNLELSPAATHLQLLIPENIQAILRAFPPEEMSFFTHRIFNHPDKSSRTISHLFRLASIRPSAVVQNIASSNWAATSRSLLTANGDIRPRALLHQNPLTEELGERLEMASRLTPTIKPNLFSNLSEQGWKPHQFLGRTLIFQKDGNYKAIKIQKKDEPISDLARQYEMVRFLNENRTTLALQSRLPNPEGLYQIDDLTSFLEGSDDKGKIDAFLEQIEKPDRDANTAPVIAYVYECEGADYFQYLHQSANVQTFSQSASASLHDLIVLLKECDLIFPQLADIFHNRVNTTGNETDGERYRALMFDGISCGSLTNWKEAVEFVNLRGSGLADEGDCSPLTDLIDKDGPLARQYFSEMFTERKFGQDAPTLLLANCIAEYMLVVELSAARWAVDQTQGQSREDTRATWQELGQEMRELYAQVLEEYAEVPRDKALAFLDAAIDWQRYARQMEFWTTDNDRMSVITQLQIPEDVYGPEVEVTLDIPDNMIATTLNNYEKWRGDLRAIPDNGPNSGLNPLLEAEKARFVVATFALRLQKDAHESGSETSPHATRGPTPDIISILPGDVEDNGEGPSHS